MTKPHIALDKETKDRFDKLHLKLQAKRGEKLLQEQVISELVDLSEKHPELLGL